MGGKDKVFMSLKAARGTMLSTNFASLLLSLHKKCRAHKSEAAALEYVDCVARLVNILRFFPQLLSPDGRMGRDSHMKLVAQVGVVCLSLEHLSTGMSSCEEGGSAPDPEWDETSRATANLVQALSAHSHGLKPKASAALHAALSRIPSSLRAACQASQRRGDEFEAGGSAVPEQTSIEDAVASVQGRDDGVVSVQGQSGGDGDPDSEDTHVLVHTRKAACSVCGRKSALYCRDCLQELPVCEGYSKDPRPQIKALLEKRAPLSLNIHIVVHNKTHPSNTTSLHAALLYPRDRVHVHVAGSRGSRACGIGSVDQEALPTSFDPSESAILFPSDDSTYVDEMSRDQVQALRRVIFIEATWECAAEVLSLPALRYVPHLKVRLGDLGGRTGRGQYWKRAPVFSRGGGEDSGAGEERAAGGGSKGALDRREDGAPKDEGDSEHSMRSMERGLTFYFRQEALKRRRAYQQHSLMLPTV